MENQKVEFGKAIPLPEWERWDIEGGVGQEALLTTPDGRLYQLQADETLVLEPKTPHGNLMPQAFIVKNNERVAFEEWAKDKENKIVK